MTDEFEKFCESLQEEIDKNARNDYSPRVIELGKNPVNWGEMEDPSVMMTYRGPCGDTMIIFLKIQGDIITDITFLTDGCVSSIASGSQVTILAKGRHIDVAYAISPDEILKHLGKLPPDSLHCPVLADRTLKKALDKYMMEK
ncbi:MAG: iron-sulfur cluster assembly scaffold protein [Promethearchaeota archaeon]